MKDEPISRFKDQRGVALVTVLMLTLLLSILVAAMLASSTADVLISGNDVRTNQAFYVAEAGIHRAAGWFSARFGTDPNTGLYILPAQNASNTDGVTGKLSYTDPAYYQKGLGSSSSEQAVPTAVKVLANGALQNVVLAGDTTNTYPASYTVNANDSTGKSKPFTYNTVVSDFTSNLVNQTEGDGKFSVKATLVSIIPPAGGQPGMVTWLLQSTGRIVRGTDTTVASATLWAYLSAKVTPIQETQLVTSDTQVVSAQPGVIGRGMISVGANQIRIDSYKSSKGGYGVSLPVNSYQGQLGAVNIGSRGDVRTNNENGGYIDISNGTVTGGGYSTLPKISPDGSYTFDPIDIDTSKVEYTAGVPFSESHKYYSQPPLTFPAIDDPPAPPAGSPNYTWSSNGSQTLPSGNYNQISVSKGTLTVPPGNYGAMNLTSQGTIVLGITGQSTTYNFQDFAAGSQATIIFKGAVTINVKNSLDVGAQGQIANTSTPASDIRWNFKGGSGQVVSIGGSGNTLGVFYAPNNKLYMRGGTTFYGAITASSVDIGGNANIHIDEDAVPGALTTKTDIIESVVTVGYTASSYSLWRITQAIN